MLKFRCACLILIIVLSNEIAGRPQFGFDIFGTYDDESYGNKDTSLMEKNGKIFSDWLSSIFDYFYEYDDSDDVDDKYLICKNCTVIVGESQNPTQATSSTTQATTTMTTNGQSSSSSTTQSTGSSDGSTTPAAAQP